MRNRYFVRDYLQIISSVAQFREPSPVNNAVIHSGPCPFRFKYGLPDLVNGNLANPLWVICPNVPDYPVYRSWIVIYILPQLRHRHALAAGAFAFAGGLYQRVVSQVLADGAAQGAGALAVDDAQQRYAVKGGVI